MASYWFVLFSTLWLFCLNGVVESISEDNKEYECVDIYKQLAFQHPLMKDHKIQMRPSSKLQAMLSMEWNGLEQSTSGSNNVCAQGQVPIHIPKANFSNKIIKSSKIITEAHLHYAIIKTFENSTNGWTGAQAVFSVYKPKVEKDQFSKAWIWLHHNEKDVTNSIQFGWAVHTELYPDDSPRLTIYCITNATPKEGCYNALCLGGYVQVHKTIYPGLAYNDVSVLGGKQYDVHLSVIRDPLTKNWLLMTRSEVIGYWPYEAYPAEGVTQAYFGGYAGEMPATTSPQMGAGTFARNSIESNSCYMEEIKYHKDHSRFIDIDSNEVEEYVDAPKCYDAWFRKFEMDNGEIFTFGGPGGQCDLLS